MSLLERSFAGAVLILAAIVLRALALNRLPKGTFLALWAVAVLRLLVPVSVPSAWSVYAWAGGVSLPEVPAVPSAPGPPSLSGTPSLAGGSFAVPAAPGLPAPPSVPGPPPVPSEQARFWLWLAGAAVCGAFFLAAYLRFRGKFRAALPVDDGFCLDWLAARGPRRRVLLRQSDWAGAPMTCGLFRPVILFPGSTDWADRERLAWVLEHELTHIRRLDALWKLVLALTACVHWFNPLVWCMFVLANRDLELRCDEAVVRRSGLERRSDYARALIAMEERKSGLGPFASAFSKNAIEERIFAIMKLKKRSFAAILTAVVLVCCIGVGFATSAAAKTGAPYPQAQDGAFTKVELDRLAELWFEGYGDLTVAAYQQKLWAEFDSPEDLALLGRYGQYCAAEPYRNDPGGPSEFSAFHDYFLYTFEPLTGDRWQARTFSGAAGACREDGSAATLEYTCTLRILDAGRLAVWEYEKTMADIKPCIQALLEGGDGPLAEDFEEIARQLSSDTLAVAIETGPLPQAGRPGEEDGAPLPGFSGAVSYEWDRLLAPYAAFGLTYEFDDPDQDGNGLTMWFQGREVRGIQDQSEGVWITEHAGNSFSEGAGELVAVYTDGALTGLRFAEGEEQAAWDEFRERNAYGGREAVERQRLFREDEEREFPYATEEDYGSLLKLLAPGSYQLSLADFNGRLLDWANANGDAWDRVNCDVVWNDYAAGLTMEELSFVSVTCRLSGTENGQAVRALYTGAAEQDPGFSASLPTRSAADGYAGGARSAWCELYYDISYHIADKSACTVAERDACVSGMTAAIEGFWRDAGLDALLGMTEEDVVARFNVWAAENSTENVQINPVTAENIHFERADERESRF